MIIRILLSFYAIFMLLISSVAMSADVKENISFIQSVLGSINKSDLSNSCGARAQDPISCSTLFKMFERDKSTGLFFGMIADSPWDLCKKQISPANNQSVTEFEKTLAQNPRTSLGLKENYFAMRASECYPANKKATEGEVLNQKKMIVSMGYDYLNRIQKSTNVLSAEVKKINSIIGEKLDSGIPCGAFIMPGDVKICSDIRKDKCESQNDLGLYTDSLIENAIAPIVALKAAHKNLSENFSRTRTLRKKENQDALNSLLSKISYIESQFPILKGEVISAFLEKGAFKNGSVPEKNVLSAIVKKQLSDNRNILTKKINENLDMNNCIVYGDDSYCKKFNDNFDRLPPHEFHTFGNNQKRNPEASEVYNAIECMDNSRGLKKEFNHFAGDVAINMGLTILTGGSGLLVRAGGQGIKAAMVMQKTMLAADAAFLGVGINDAVDNCSKELDKLEISTDVKNVATNSCPLAMSKPEHSVTSNYQSCITGAMLAGVNALPFTPAIVSKYLARTKRTPASELATFKTPKKSFDPHDLRVAGDIMPAGTLQKADDVFKRDGVYVYIVDDKGTLVLSHRTPDLKAGVEEGAQFLGTHRGLYNKLAEKSRNVSVVSAGEIRVVGGQPISVSTRAGSFHTTPEEVLLNMKKGVAIDPKEKAAIDSILKEMESLPSDVKNNAGQLEMYLDELIEKNPVAETVIKKVQNELNSLTDKRLQSAREAMESRGLLSKDVETNFTREVGGDAHIEGKAAAIAEITCARNATCAAELGVYQKKAREFLVKYKSPKNIENAVVSKLTFNELSSMNEKERAFHFFNMRSSLLFKEGPIEFMKNAHPEKFNLTDKEALKYLDQWAAQFL